MEFLDVIQVLSDIVYSLVFGDESTGIYYLAPFQAIASLINNTGNMIQGGVQAKRARKERAAMAQEDRRRYEDDLRQREFENKLTKEQHGLSMDMGREQLDSTRKRKAASAAGGKSFAAALMKKK